MTGRAGFVTGLAIEAAILRAAFRRVPEARRPSVFCAGADAGRAEAGARRLVEAGAVGLVSFGCAGGLDPALVAGTLVLADAVHRPDGRVFPTDAGWRRRAVAGWGGAVVVAPVAGADRPLTRPADKRDLRRLTGARAVDMESHGVAAAANALGVPFLAVRAVADPAERAVPAAFAAVGPDGRVRLAPALTWLLARPWRVAAAAGLAREGLAAFGTLRRVARRMDGAGDGPPGGAGLGRA